MTTADQRLQTLIDAPLPDRPLPVTVTLEHVDSLLRLPAAPKVAFIERIVLTDEMFTLHPRGLLGWCER